MANLYTILLYLIQPLICLRLWIRGRKNPAYRKRWAERYGYCYGKVKPYGIVLHCVSVGEIIAAVPLINALRCYYPILPITVTTMTPTGSENTKAKFGNNVYHVYLPYDIPCAIKRFLDIIKPKLMIIMETELWPNIIRILHQRHIPLIIANARLSERSAKSYKKIGNFMCTLLQHITLVAAQSTEDGERFLSLGLKESHLAITGNIKFDISLTSQLTIAALTLRRQWAPDRPVWIASSTHKGEENIVLNVHRRLLKYFPKLLLILVPRHAERFQDVCNLVSKLGLMFTLRSSGDIPSSTTKVVIGNTMGELMLLYGIADLAFIGGSLVAHGGHNPLEAAVHTIPILTGPHTWNFKDICNKLQKAKGLINVEDEFSLEKEIISLLNSKYARENYGHNAVKVLHQNQGALNDLIYLLKPYLPLRSK